MKNYVPIIQGSILFHKAFKEFNKSLNFTWTYQSNFSNFQNIF